MTLLCVSMQDDFGSMVTGSHAGEDAVEATEWKTIRLDAAHDVLTWSGSLLTTMMTCTTAV